MLPILARLSKKFQNSDLNFGRFQASLETARTAIKTLKDAPGPVFSQTDKFIDDLQLPEEEDRRIVITSSSSRKKAFDKNVRLASLQALLDCLQQRFPALPILDALLIFDPKRVPSKRSAKFPTYGLQGLEVPLESWLDPTMKNHLSMPMRRRVSGLS